MKQISDQLPVKKYKKMIDVKSFVKLAKEVKKSFEEQQKYSEQEQCQNYYPYTRQFVQFT